MSPPNHQSVSRRDFLVTMAGTSAAVGALAVGISPPISLAAEAPAGVSTSFEGRFSVEQPPTVPFEVVQIVVDFPIGARGARHVNSGPGFLTVLDGEIRMWIGEQPATTYVAGESFAEPFGAVIEAANPGSTQASLLVTYLIPAGAAVSAPAGVSAPPAGERSPSPSPRFQSRMRIDEVLPYSQVSHSLQTYGPGAWTPTDEPQAARLLTVVTGVVTVMSGGTQQTYTAGQHWIESRGQAWLSGNPGNSSAIVAVSTTHATDTAVPGNGPAAAATQPPDALSGRLKRTEVQRSTSSIPGREIVQVLTEIPAGVESGWHVHPGEEVGYILAGIVEMMVQGQPTRTLRAGDGFLIPPQTPHNAFDVGPEVGQMLSTYIVELGQPLATFTG